MQLGLGRRIAVLSSMVLGVVTLAACLPGGGETPPPPWCTPLGIDILEEKLELAQRLESDELIDLVEHKLAACGEVTDLGTDGPDGGTDLGGVLGSDGGDDGGEEDFLVCHWNNGQGVYQLQNVGSQAAVNAHLNQHDDDVLPQNGLCPLIGS